MKGLKKSHLFTFVAIIGVAYGAIFLRVENWPFTDWRVFAWPYHPSKVFVFSLKFEDKQSTNKKILQEIGFSTTKFNTYVYKAYIKNDTEKIANYIEKIKRQKEFVDYARSKDCPCKVVLTLKKLNLDGGVKVEEKTVEKYDI